MNIPDAAARIGVSTRTIWRWIRTGQLRTTQAPRDHRGHEHLWRHDIALDDLIDADDRRDAHSLAHLKRKKVA